MKKFLINLALMLLLIISTGCTGHAPEPVIAEKDMTVEQGVVQSVRKIEIRNSNVGTVVGSVVGSVGGSVAGAKVGSGTGQVLASVLGSVLGSMAGGTVGNNMTKNYSQEVTVTLDNGTTSKVVLNIDSDTAEFTVGQEVNVFYHNNKVSKVVVR